MRTILFEHKLKWNEIYLRNNGTSINTDIWVVPKAILDDRNSNSRPGNNAILSADPENNIVHHSSPPTYTFDSLVSTPKFSAPRLHTIRE